MIENPLIKKEWKTARWFMLLFLLTYIKFVGELAIIMNAVKSTYLVNDFPDAIFMSEVYELGMKLLPIMLGVIIALVIFLFAQDRTLKVSKFLSTLPFERKERFTIKYIMGLITFTVPFLALIGGTLILRVKNEKWISHLYKYLSHGEAIAKQDSLGKILLLLCIVWLILMVVYSFLMFAQIIIEKNIWVGVIGVIVLVFSLLFLEWGSGKIEELPEPRSIDQSDDKKMGEDAITLEGLVNELEDHEVKIDLLDSVNRDLLEEYSYDLDHAKITMITQRALEGSDKRMLQTMIFEVDDNHKEDVYAEEVKLHENPFIKSAAGLIQDETLTSWIADLEEEYKERKLNKTDSGNNQIVDMKVIGRTHVVFVGDLEEGYKGIEISWRNEGDIPQEFERVVTELEEEGLVTFDYIRGYEGNMINLESKEYCLIQRVKSDVTKDEDIEDINNIVSYKVMYDPDEKQHYSAKLYGLIPVKSSEIVKVDEMVGINAISKVMDMNSDDFNELTSVLNQELVKAKKSFLVALEEGEMTEGLVGSCSYKQEGQVAGYSYQIYAEPRDGFNNKYDHMFGKIYGFNGFTVLIEKR